MYGQCPEETGFCQTRGGPSGAMAVLPCSGCSRRLGLHYAPPGGTAPQGSSRSRAAGQADGGASHHMEPSVCEREAAAAV